MKNIFIIVSILGVLIFSIEGVSAMPLVVGEGISGRKVNELNRLAIDIDISKVDRDFIPFSIWFIDKCTTIKNIKLPPIKALNIQKLVNDYTRYLQVLRSV